MKERLSERLQAVCSMVPDACAAADIGCDHAFAVIHLVESGRIPCAAASDIRPGPVKTAQRHVEEAFLGDRIAVLTADGVPEELNRVLFERFGYQGPVTVILAGMGGLLMSDILRRAVTGPVETGPVVASPQRDPGTFRRTLAECGYVIEDEITVLDRGKLYPVIRALPSDGAVMLSELEAEFGPVLLSKKDHETRKRIRREYEQTVKILAVLSPENERQSVRIGELLKRKELLEEALSIYRTDTGTAGFGLRAGSEAEARSQGE